MEAPEYFVRSGVVDSCACSVVCEIQGFLILKLLELSPVAVAFCVCAVLLQLICLNWLCCLTQRSISHVRVFQIM